ncbi:MAG: helix-turn-helix transcriptional regulator [Isosphaeraceae bacterium]
MGSQSRGDDNETARREAASTRHGSTMAAAIDPLLRINDLERWLACDRRTIERMRASGKLPKPDLLIGRRSPRWLASTIQAWIERGGRP